MDPYAHDQNAEPTVKINPSRPKVIWGNLTFFLVTAILGVIGTYFYISHFGILIREILLFGFYTLITGFGITVGYHRLFAHSAFKANAFVRFLVLFFGAAAFEQSALKWTSQHRDHHRYVDTDQDPYSIKKGFFYAHIGWLIFWEHSFNYDNVKDLQKSKLIMHQHQFYIWWAVISGIILPVAIGALMGHALGAFLLSVCARLTLVYQATWCINSVCHMFGKSTYDIYSSAKDSWAAAIITGGEGYHNYHHHFPGDYRNGVRWYQFDPTKWIIAGLAKIGFVWDLKTVSGFRIIAAQISAEKQQVEDRLRDRIENPNSSTFHEMLQTQYEKLRQALNAWEHSVRDYQAILRQHIKRHSETRREAALKSLEARRQFQESLAQWKLILQLQLQTA